MYIFIYCKNKRTKNKPKINTIILCSLIPVVFIGLIGIIYNYNRVKYSLLDLQVYLNQKYDFILRDQFLIPRQFQSVYNEFKHIFSDKDLENKVKKDIKSMIKDHNNNDNNIDQIFSFITPVLMEDLERMAPFDSNYVINGKKELEKIANVEKISRNLITVTDNIDEKYEWIKSDENKNYLCINFSKHIFFYFNHQKYLQSPKGELILYLNFFGKIFTYKI